MGCIEKVYQRGFSYPEVDASETPGSDAVLRETSGLCTAQIIVVVSDGGTGTLTVNGELMNIESGLYVNPIVGRGGHVACQGLGSILQEATSHL